MPETPSKERPVVIAGAGWAGLATAVELSTHGVPVLLLEAARQLGGRARSIRSGDMIVDNGQHLMIGAYQSLLTLMERVHVDHKKAFLRLPLTLNMRRGNRTSLYFRAPRLPAPLHLLWAILTARGLGFQDRVQAMRFGRHLPTLDIPADGDISVQALLHSEAQSPALIRKLWEPLCVATLNRHAGDASARLFLQVLRETFLELCRHSDLLIPRHELSAILPRPCADYLERKGARVEMGQRVTGLQISDTVRGVRLYGREIEASHVVLATPHIISRRLMSHHAPLHTVCEQLAGLGNEPIATLYLQYPPRTRLPTPVTGLEDTLTQWVFDRRVSGQPGLMAVVISAQGTHTDMSAEALTARVADELQRAFPHWPTHLNSLLVREKRATFSSHPGIDNSRPGNATAVPGLWLAGDYTATGLPATLEGAVRSGIRCANAILEQVR